MTEEPAKVDVHLLLMQVIDDVVSRFADIMTVGVTSHCKASRARFRARQARCRSVALARCAAHNVPNAPLAAAIISSVAPAPCSASTTDCGKVARASAHAFSGPGRHYPTRTHAPDRSHGSRPHAA
jgi:hypothetical protein